MPCANVHTTETSNVRSSSCLPCAQCHPALVLCPCCRQLQALCAEHAAALLACNARRPLAQHDPDTVITTLYSLAAAIADGPVAVGLDPALHALFDQLWSKVARVSHANEHCAALLACTATCCFCCGCLTILDSAL